MELHNQWFLTGLKHLASKQEGGSSSLRKISQIETSNNALRLKQNTLSEALQELEREKEREETTMSELRADIASLESVETARLIAAKLAATCCPPAHKPNERRASRFDFDGDAQSRVPPASSGSAEVVAKAFENAQRRARIANPCEDMKKGHCKHGDYCLHSHDVIPYPFCHAYNNTGRCTRPECRFNHALFEYVPPNPVIAAHVESMRRRQANGQKLRSNSDGDLSASKYKPVGCPPPPLRHGLGDPRDRPPSLAWQEGRFPPGHFPPPGTRSPPGRSPPSAHHGPPPQMRTSPPGHSNPQWASFAFGAPQSYPPRGVTGMTGQHGGGFGGRNGGRGGGRENVRFNGRGSGGFGGDGRGRGGGSGRMFGQQMNGAIGVPGAYGLYGLPRGAHSGYGGYGGQGQSQGQHGNGNIFSAAPHPGYSGGAAPGGYGQGGGFEYGFGHGAPGGYGGLYGGPTFPAQHAAYNAASFPAHVDSEPVPQAEAPQGYGTGQSYVKPQNGGAQDQQQQQQQQAPHQHQHQQAPHLAGYSAAVAYASARQGSEYKPPPKFARPGTFPSH